MKNQKNRSIYRRLAITTASTALFALVAIAPSVQADSNIEQAGIDAPFIMAATEGVERRKDRRGDRRDDRAERPHDRQDCRQEEGVVGKDKRDCKQSARQDRRND